jgi:hypothetical protein
MLYYICSSVGVGVGVGVVGEVAGSVVCGAAGAGG